MLYYRIHPYPPLTAVRFGDALTRTLACLRDAGIADPLVRFFFGDAIGSASGCDRICSRFPELERFAPVRDSRPVPLQPARPSNLGPYWDGTGCTTGDVTLATLVAIAARIPDEFLIAIACVVLGPFKWIEGVEPVEAAMRRRSARVPPFSVRAPSMTYLAPSVVVQWLAAGGTRLYATEQLPDDDSRAPVAPAIERLNAEFGTAKPSQVLSIPEE